MPCNVRQLVWYFLRLGATGFGGPIALAGYMQRDLVERRGWFSKEDFVEGLAFAQLCPGPLAAQLAMYLAWLRAGTTGAILVSLAFVGPSFLMVLTLAALYVQHHDRMGWIQGAFYGIGAAVIAVMVRSTYKLSRLALASDWLLWSIFAVAALVTASTRSEVVWVFVLGGIVTLLVRAPPRFSQRPLSLSLGPQWTWLVSGLHSREPADAETLWTLLWFFSKAGFFVFGSGLAIIPFLRQGVVVQFEWLDRQQFLDAVAVAMITPGPVVITAGFIGYLVGGPVGSTLAALGVFLPPLLLVLILAPHYRKFAQNKQVKEFVRGVTAAATGAIAGATYLLGQDALYQENTGFELPAVGIALVVLAVLLGWRKAPEPLIIVAAGVAGLLVKQFDWGSLTG